MCFWVLMPRPARLCAPALLPIQTIWKKKAFWHEATITGIRDLPKGREQPPELYVADTPGGEAKAIVAKLVWLIREEKVRPEDILVIGIERDRLRQLADYITARLQGVLVFLPFEPHNKDDYLTKKGHVTISTVHSSKGYDAYCVLFLSANTAFDDDTDSRAAFYVACTRAREHLYLFAHTKTGLTAEFSRTLRQPNTTAVVPTNGTKGQTIRKLQYHHFRALRIASLPRWNFISMERMPSLPTSASPAPLASSISSDPTQVKLASLSP